jgi:hypothetical protein
MRSRTSPTRTARLPQPATVPVSRPTASRPSSICTRSATAPSSPPSRSPLAGFRSTRTLTATTKRPRAPLLACNSTKNLFGDHELRPKPNGHQRPIPAATGARNTTSAYCSGLPTSSNHFCASAKPEWSGLYHQLLPPPSMPSAPAQKDYSTV